MTQRLKVPVDVPKPQMLFHLHLTIKKRITEVQAGSAYKFKREGIFFITLQIITHVRGVMLVILHEVSVNRINPSHQRMGWATVGQQRKTVWLATQNDAAHRRGAVVITGIWG